MWITWIHKVYRIIQFNIENKEIHFHLNLLLFLLVFYRSPEIIPPGQLSIKAILILDFFFLAWNLVNLIEEFIELILLICCQAPTLKKINLEYNDLQTLYH